jgi:hypothetical protein
MHIAHTSIYLYTLERDKERGERQRERRGRERERERERGRERERDWRRAHVSIMYYCIITLTWRPRLASWPK